MNEPTGRHRFREEKRLFRKSLMVLQYEWKVLRISNYGGYIDSDYILQWRDATVQDSSVDMFCEEET